MKKATKCYNRQTIFPKILSASSEPGNTTRKACPSALELAELVEDPRTLTCYAEIKHAIGFLLPRNRD
ncbi:hypothetical protein NQ317_010670 [Molorchus minor]|uniref:Uncharacterized protein n=1 Tax=Molorchus minor TaxID=1323400 RepID=A0ABQ9K8G1_9CUCU|nr:hypothetical protein NQ317_010670 [Molorchus minor]